VADIVGNSNDLRLALRNALHEAKGEVPKKDPLGAEPLNPDTAYKLSPGHQSAFSLPIKPSTAIVIGHSFGGIVLEHAATTLLRNFPVAGKPSLQ